MKTETRRLIVFSYLLICGFSLLATTTKGQSPSTPSDTDTFPEFLYIDVRAPSLIKNVIKSGLLKRLREFKGVQIMPTIDSAFDIFYVQAVELQSKDGVLTGYSINVVYASTYLLFALQALASAHANSDFFKSQIHDQAIYDGQATYICSPDDLDRILNKIVADIDVNVLELSRQTFHNASKEDKTREH
jgi:hypothetical protein